MSHCFRIRFFLSDRTMFDYDESSIDIEIPGDGGTYLLRTPGENGSIKNSSELILIGSGFETEEQATAAGKRAKDALAVAAGQSRLGLNLGKDKASSGASNYLKAKIFEEFGVRVLNNVHGLLVYDEETPTHFISMKASASVLTPLAPFVEAFQSATASDFELTDRGRLALELYGISAFESSPYVRLLTLVMVVEVLAPPSSRTQQAIEHVEKLMRITRESDLEKSTTDSMLGSLERLKTESISASGRCLVEEYLGTKTYDNKLARKFFSECYEIRSKIVHEGKIPERNGEFSHTISALDQLVTDLFRAGAV